MIERLDGMFSTLDGYLMIVDYTKLIGKLDRGR